MMQINVNGQFVDVLTTMDFEFYLSTHFHKAFDEHLKAQYGITPEQLERVIKNSIPEDLI